jgi:uncharacterized surface protein with fasciclin (FAS1) repeats
MKFTTFSFAATLACLMVLSQPASALWPFDDKKPAPAPEAPQAAPAPAAEQAPPPASMPVPKTETDTSNAFEIPSSSAPPTATTTTKTTTTTTAPHVATPSAPTPPTAPTVTTTTVKEETTKAGDTTKTETKAETKTEAPKPVTTPEPAENKPLNQQVSVDPGEEKSIAGELIAKGNFKTFLGLMAQADLLNVLKKPGTFTAFVPTDEAFSKLPKSQLEDLKKPDNRDRLRSVLSYHLMNGKYEIKAHAGQKGAPNALQGDVLYIDMTGKEAKIGTADVTQADVPASNGVYHVINQVLIPPVK